MQQSWTDLEGFAIDGNVDYPDNMVVAGLKVFTGIMVIFWVMEGYDMMAAQVMSYGGGRSSFIIR